MPTPNNPWLNQYQRSYTTIKNKLLSKLTTNLPEVTDRSEGNIFIMLISMFAAIGEVIHYYLDSKTREAFMPVAKRYDSLQLHAKTIDYHIRGAIPSTVDILVYKSNSQPSPTDITIPAGTEFTSDEGFKWLSTKTVIWRSGQYSIRVPVKQFENRYTDYTNIVTTSNRLKYINIIDIPSNKYYADGTMECIIGGEQWELVETFAYYKSNSKVFIVDVLEDGTPQINFGDGIYGAIPGRGLQVNVNFKVTNGRNIVKDSFNNSIPTLLSNVDSTIKLKNIHDSSGASTSESFDMLKEHLPLSLKTMGTAITKDDYESLAKLAPGVDKAYVNYICGRFIQIYITPDGGGIAGQALLDSTYQFIFKHKVFITSIDIRPTIVTKAFITLTIKGKPSFNSITITNQVKKALIDEYNTNTSSINKPLRLSDLYSILDQLSTVDYLTIDKLFLMPYNENRNTVVGQPDLVITNFNEIEFNGTGEEFFIVKIIDTSNYIIYSSSTPENLINCTFNSGVLIQGVKAKFYITIDGTVYYPTDAMYKLTVQGLTTNLVPYGYAIPIFESDSINVIVDETV